MGQSSPYILWGVPSQEPIAPVERWILLFQNSQPQSNGSHRSADWHNTHSADRHVLIVFVIRCKLLPYRLKLLTVATPGTEIKKLLYSKQCISFLANLVTLISKCSLTRVHRIPQSAVHVWCTHQNYLQSKMLSHCPSLPQPTKSKLHNMMY